MRERFDRRMKKRRAGEALHDWISRRQRVAVVREYRLAVNRDPVARECRRSGDEVDRRLRREHRFDKAPLDLTQRLHWMPRESAGRLLLRVAIRRTPECRCPTRSASAASPG